jgi:protein-tyrosine phosphatase
MMPSVLFVCLGNICRSPAAEGILRLLVEREKLSYPVEIQSCGLGDWHTGKLPDERMREAAKKRGLTLMSRAQKVQPHFFDQFDFIFAADHKVMNELYKYASTPDYKSKIYLMTHFSNAFRNQEVPDPYYDNISGFETVLDMLEDSCSGILEHLKANNRE